MLSRHHNRERSAHPLPHLTSASGSEEAGSGQSLKWLVPGTGFVSDLSDDPWSPRRASRLGRLARAGFTFIEILIALAMLSIVLSIGAGSYQNLQRAAAVDRGAKLLASDIALARRLAIEKQSPVTLELDEAEKDYLIRAGGDVLIARNLGPGTDIPLTDLECDADGDAMTFNARGMMVAAGPTTIDLSRHADDRRVVVNLLGQARIEEVE